jgi:hypothetical protein
LLVAKCMHRVITVLTLLLTVTGLRAIGQEYFTTTETGVAIGGSQYFGDLNDNYSFRTPHLAGGIYVRKHFTNYISAKIVANYTHVSFDDKYNSAPYQQQRNLSFESDIIELAAQAEFNFFRFVTGDPYHRFTPYLTCGIGAFYYDPYTTYAGGRASLRALGTEGQFVGHADRKYSNVSACFPLGVGVKFWIVGGVNLTLEIADRLTVTDYMDDVSSTYVGADKFIINSTNRALQDRSVEKTPKTPLGRPGKQRGNNSTLDQYAMALLSISWHFTTYRCPAALEGDMIRAY